MADGGARLREARLRRGLELAEVAERLGVQPKELRALEWDRPDLLPDAGRAAGVLGAYERFLGLASSTAPPGAEVPAPRSGSSWRRFVLPGLGAASLLLGGLVGVALFRDGADPASTTRPAATRSTTTATAVPEQPVSEPTPPPPPASPTTDAVVVASRGDSWVEARANSATGEELYAGVLARGRSVQLSAARIWLRLGAAANVDVRVNGKPVPGLSGTVAVLLAPAGPVPA